MQTRLLLSGSVVSLSLVSDEYLVSKRNYRVERVIRVKGELRITTYRKKTYTDGGVNIVVLSQSQSQSQSHCYHRDRKSVV